MAGPEIIKLKLLNKLSGEISRYEIDINDPTALATAEIEAKAFIEEIDKFRAQIKEYAEYCLSNNDWKPVETADRSWQWVRRAPVTYNYQFETVSRFIDPDRMITYRGKKGSPLVKIQSGPLKELMAEMVDSGELPVGAKDEMINSAEAKATKPYVMLERLV